MITPANELLTVAETACEFECSESTVRQWITERTIPAVMVGDVAYVRRTVVDNMMGPARRIEAECAALEAAGLPVLTAEQLGLVRRVFDEALDDLRAAQSVETISA